MQKIVDPKILTLIGRLAKFPIRDQQHGQQRYHAGLIHTFGYLFSNLKTRFGYKRDRWVDGKLDASFGWPQGTLLGTHGDGNLFANVSFLFSKIVLPKSNRTVSTLESALVSDHILNCDFQKAKNHAPY